ncbi:MAG TPA: hypothetical protein VN893_26235 [Bryobacteraceae bacterium]|nr:hypothetical protein [Bryobacteraceae bacterium]
MVSCLNRLLSDRPSGKAASSTTTNSARTVGMAQAGTKTAVAVAASAILIAASSNNLVKRITRIQ